MLIEAIYDQGRLKFLEPIRLKHDQFRIQIELPDDEVIPIAQPVRQLAPDPNKRTHGLSQQLLDLRNRLDQIRNAPLPSDIDLMTEEEAIRWKAFTEIRETGHD